jgi:hypothetical protein
VVTVGFNPFHAHTQRRSDIALVAIAIVVVVVLVVWALFGI